MVNLSDFVTGADSITPEGGNPKDGTYAYEITAIRVQKGTTNKPQNVWILVEFRLESGERYTAWNSMPMDPRNPAPKEVDALRRYLALLVDLGVPRDQANSYDTDQMIGWTGTMTLVTTTGKNDGREYQNIRRGSLFPSSQAAPVSGQASAQQGDPWAPAQAPVSAAPAPQETAAPAAAAPAAAPGGNPFA